MKKYIAPALNELAFAANEVIANDIPDDASNLFNDAEFGQW